VFVDRGRNDFFISYTSVDEPWAEWISHVLEEAGYAVIVQAWDFRPGSNFVIQMQRALQSSDRLIAVLSPDYLEARFSRSEWAAVFATDPEGVDRRLIPVVVRQCQPDGLLGQLVRIALHDVDRAVARQRLLDGVQIGRAKPADPPAFPGAIPSIPTPSRPPERHSINAAARPGPGRRPGADSGSRWSSDGPWPHQVGVVPPEAGCFQLRPVAADLDAVLAHGRTAVVSGLGGVGKTQVAASLARQAWNDGVVDLLVWVSAASRDAVVSAYAQAAAEVAGAASGAADTAARRFLAWLVETSRRWLVVLDDVADPGDLDGWWPPSTPAGRVVVTTRRRDATLLGRGRLVEVGLYTPSEATSYLRDKLGDAPERLIGAEALAADVDFLPLALAQAAAYIADRAIDCGIYRSRFADQRRQLADISPEPGSLPDDYGTPVATTWALSVEAADRLAPAGLAHPVLRLLSLLDSNGVPTSVLTAPATLKLLARMRMDDGVDTPVPAEDARDAAACLQRLSLATYSQSDTHPTVRVHALVQRTSRERTPPGLITDMARAAADALAESWPEVERDTSTGRLLRANTAVLRGHVEDALWRPEPHAVLFRAGRSLGEAGLVAEAVTHFDDLAAQCTNQLGPDHADTLFARRGAAHWRGEAGDPTGAAAALEAVLADCLRVLGPDHRHTLDTRGGLAHWRGMAGSPTDGGIAFGVLPAHRSEPAPERADTPAAIRDAARWRGVAGDPAGAAAALEALLTDRRRVLGPDHPDTLATRREAACWRGEDGDPAGAVAALALVLNDCWRILGPDHPDTLAARGSLMWWQGEDDPTRAAAGFETLLDDRRRVLGPDHPDTLATLGDVAWWRGVAGDPDAACVGFDAQLAHRLRVLGSEHPHTLGARRDLAWWQGEAGKPADAAAALGALLDDCVRVLGPDHPDTMATRHSLSYWQGVALTPDAGSAERRLATT
jgi:hypothetical protein